MEQPDAGHDPADQGLADPARASLWGRYAAGAGVLSLIMDHCLSDLLREAILLFRYPQRAGPLTE